MRDLESSDPRTVAMTVITLRPVGQSLGVELPADILARLNLKAGDALLLSEAADGTLQIVRADLGHDEQMRLAREGMRDYRDALRELAK
jgi:putative addiction module antidote